MKNKPNTRSDQTPPKKDGEGNAETSSPEDAPKAPEANENLAEQVQQLLDAQSQINSQFEQLKASHTEEIKALKADYEGRIEKLEANQESNDKFAAHVLAKTGIPPIDGAGAGEGEGDGEDNAETQSIEQHWSAYHKITDPKEKSAYYSQHIRPVLYPSKS